MPYFTVRVLNTIPTIPTWRNLHNHKAWHAGNFSISCSLRTPRNGCFSVLKLSHIGISVGSCSVFATAGRLYRIIRCVVAQSCARAVMQHMCWIRIHGGSGDLSDPVSDQCADQVSQGPQQFPKIWACLQISSLFRSELIRSHRFSTKSINLLKTLEDFRSDLT